MTWHVLCLRGSDDAFRPAIGLADQVLEVPFGISGHAQTVHCSVASVLAQHGLMLSESAEDLLVAAISAYAADAGIPRRRAIAALRQRYDANVAPYYRFWVSPPKIALGVTEITTRGRSMLFLALGAAVADAVQATQLIVPENGFISLNVPLTPSRIG